MKKTTKPPQPQLSPLDQFLHWCRTEWPEWSTNWPWLVSYYMQRHPGRIAPLLSQLLEERTNDPGPDQLRPTTPETPRS